MDVHAYFNAQTFSEIKLPAVESLGDGILISDNVETFPENYLYLENNKSIKFTNSVDPFEYDCIKMPFQIV